MRPNALPRNLSVVVRLLRMHVVGVVTALLLLGAGRLGAADAVLDVPASSVPDIQTVKDIAYYQGSDADPVKHRLDLFLPRDRKDFPVLLFVHGGAWRHGDKSQLGVYSTFGRFLARHGVGAVITNYRLSPAVKHPEHVRDVARAFAWTYQNIARYGGSPDRLFVCGHSAGAHLVSLLATDPSYLEEVGLSPRTIRGVVPISGVYDIPEKLFVAVFGNDVEVRKKAGPVHHVRAGAPPFLILYADKDYPTIDKMSEEFCNALKGCDCEAGLVEVKDRNHFSIILLASSEGDPVAKALLGFIAARSKGPATGSAQRSP